MKWVFIFMLHFLKKFFLIYFLTKKILKNININIFLINFKISLHYRTKKTRKQYNRCMDLRCNMFLKIVFLFVLLLI